MLGMTCRLFYLFSFLLCFLVCSTARAGETTSDTNTLSPYFMIEDGDPELDQLPLESTKVAFAISGVIADVNVTQVYKNQGKRPINARYVFPASTRAAVHGMRMTIRDQVIEAQIKERKQAEKTFETAKKQGKSATLLEQQRPNVFTMSVANILPGDRVEVLLRYTELLVPNEGTYEVVFPTVVGPRYSNLAAASASKTDEFIATPYTKQGKAPTFSFELSGTLSTSTPVRELASTTHKLSTSSDNPNFHRFALDGAEKSGANRDFILRYRLAGDAIQSGLSLYDAGSEKFFLLMVEPPARVLPDAMPAREFVFIVDVSGSMSGFPLDTTKKLIRDLISTLRPQDKFNVLLFSGGSELLSPKSLAGTPANIAKALRTIDNEQGGGGTELLPALERALSLSKEPGLARSFVIVTDGYIGADKQAMDYVASHLGDANVFAFGIGTGVNRYLIEGLARAGAGEPFIVSEPAQAEKTAKRFADYIKAPVLTDIAVKYEGFDAYAVEPRAIPDVLAERPVVVHGKWRGAPKGNIVVTGVSGKGPFSQRFEVAVAPPRPENRALSYLWARTRISLLSDFGFAEPSEKAQSEITALGLRYNLLTQYTSFVAVSKLVRNTQGPGADVKQPLALPQGVSNSAIGDASLESASEPSLWLLLLLIAGLSAATWLARSNRLAS